MKMQSYGQILRLREGAEDEYEQLHKAVWPEVLETIRKSGVQNYHIFRHGQWLFSYFELPDDIVMSDVTGTIAASRACRRWEELMHSLQEPLPESQGEVWWVPMKSVWNLGGAP